jgi:hypothetical protein
VGLSTRDFERWLKGSWRWGLPLYGVSVKGTWREDFLVGEPGEYVEKALETGVSFHRRPAGESGRMLVYRGL